MYIFSYNGKKLNFCIIFLKKLLFKKNIPRKNNLDFKTKAKIIEEFNIENKTQKQLANEYNIDQSSISRILKNKQKILNAIKVNSTTKIKSFSKGKFTELEDILIKFLQITNDNFLPINKLIKEKSLEIAKKLNIEEFSASDGWYQNFLKRKSLKQKSTIGTEQKINEKTTSNCRQEDLKNILQKYNPENIYNYDETGIYYELLPNKAICKSTTETKFHLNSKKRLTLLLACNFTGSKKLTPVVIGMSKSPRCLKELKVCLSSIDQINHLV